MTLRFVSFESRRATDLSGLLGRAGFEAVTAPSMQEVPLEGQREVIAFADRLLAADYDLLVLMTGVGFRMLIEAAQTVVPREELLAALARRPIACRGPKPVAVLKELGMQPTVVAPSPNTYRELLAVLGELGDLSGRRVVIQEYGVPNPEFDQALLERGARIEKLPVYAWRLPDDLGPLRAAISEICDGRVDGVVFTSQQQFRHVLEIAEGEGKKDLLLRRFSQEMLVASVGPITTEVLASFGVPVDLEPVHPKMGHLVKLLREQADAALAEKRARA